MITEGSLFNDKPRAAGEIPHYHPLNNTRTAIAAGAILFGRAVMKAAGETLATYATTAEKFEGVAAIGVEATNYDTETYAQYDVMGVVDAGYVSVYVEEAVTPDDPVRIRHTAATGKVPGSFCTTAEANKTTLLSGAKFRGTATAAGLVIVELQPTFTTTDDV